MPWLTRAVGLAAGHAPKHPGKGSALCIACGRQMNPQSKGAKCNALPNDNSRGQDGITAPEPVAQSDV